MIVLTETTDAIELVLASGTSTSVETMAYWRDITTTAYTPGRTQSASNGTTPVDIIAGPGASTQRVVDRIRITNRDASAQTVRVNFDANGTERREWHGSLGPDEACEYENGRGWKRLTSSGSEVENVVAQNDLQVFTTPGAGTWTKPTTFTPTWVMVVAYGAGGGGGGGAAGTGAAVRTGGCGGGGGARSVRLYRASDLGTTEPVSVATGGTAGTAGPSAGDGGDGGNGGNSTFSTGVTLHTAYGGGGGRRGVSSATAGGGGGGGGSGAAGTVGTAAAGTGGGPGAPTAPSGGTGGSGSDRKSVV